MPSFVCFLCADRRCSNSGPLGLWVTPQPSAPTARVADAPPPRPAAAVQWSDGRIAACTYHGPVPSKSRKRLTFMPSAPRRCRTRTAGNRAKAAAPPPRPAAATTRRHRRRQEPATKLAGGTQCVFLAASFGQPAVHTSQMHCAPSNPPKIHIYVPCAPLTLTCTAGSLGCLGRKRACRLPAGGCLWSHGKAGRVSRHGQAALPGGSARRSRLRSFPELCWVAGGHRGPPLAAAGGAGRDPRGRGTAGGRKDKKNCCPKTFCMEYSRPPCAMVEPPRVLYGGAVNQIRFRACVITNKHSMHVPSVVVSPMPSVYGNARFARIPSL